VSAHAECARVIRGAGYLKTGALARGNAAAMEKSIFAPLSLSFPISALAKIVEGGVGLSLDNGGTTFKVVGHSLG